MRWQIGNQEKLMYSGIIQRKELLKSNEYDGLDMARKEEGRVKKGITVPKICQCHFIYVTDILKTSKRVCEIVNVCFLLIKEA